MSTVLYSLTGIFALIAISFFITYLGTRKNDKIALRLASIRKAVALTPDRLLFVPHKPGVQFLAATEKVRNRKINGMTPYGTNSVL